MTASPSPGPQIPQALVDYQRIATGGGSAELADLYAEDAVFWDSRGGVQRGRAAIRTHYAEILSPGVTMAWTWGRVAIDGEECWAELELDGRLLATDHFTIGPDGLITRMVMFARPHPPA
jgi:hypothetical protein